MIMKIKVAARTDNAFSRASQNFSIKNAKDNPTIVLKNIYFSLTYNIQSFHLSSFFSCS